MPKKVTIEILVTFSISFIIYFLVDFNFIFVTEWRQNQIFNFIHTWLTMLTAYYLYNLLLKYAFNRWVINEFRRWMWLLVVISILVSGYAIMIDLIFYWLYYDVVSLYQETTFYEFDLPVILVFVITSSLFFYQKYYHGQITGNADHEPEVDQKIKGTKGKKVVLTDVNDIGLIYSEGGIVWLFNKNGEKHTIDYTLDRLLDELSADQFFRLNRQSIVSRDCITGFSKLDYQKLEVSLVDAIHDHKPLVVSKYNAPAFKKWLTNSA